MIDLERFNSKIQSFDPDYLKGFDNFWRWKLKVEKDSANLLDNGHRSKTLRFLTSILRGWQAYRPLSSEQCSIILSESLAKMSNAYDVMRRCSLLDVDDSHLGKLRLIWNELGRIKEEKGDYNPSESYLVVSLSKHLMFLWGQTPSFDSGVREQLHKKYSAPTGNRWDFEEWIEVMKHLQSDLGSDSSAIQSFREEALRRYGDNSIVPYGRFLDIYYAFEA